MSSALPQIADQAGSPIDASVSAADMTGSEDLEKAAKRVRDCGNYLIFARGERTGCTPLKRLAFGNLCGNRLCAVCARAHASKLYGQIKAVDDRLQETEPHLVPLLITFPVRLG
jgi:hypothetical protein